MAIAIVFTPSRPWPIVAGAGQGRGPVATFARASSEPRSRGERPQGVLVHAGAGEVLDGDAGFAGEEVGEVALPSESWMPRGRGPTSPTSAPARDRQGAGTVDGRDDGFAACPDGSSKRDRDHGSGRVRRVPTGEGPGRREREARGNRRCRERDHGRLRRCRDAAAARRRTACVAAGLTRPARSPAAGSRPRRRRSGARPPPDR